MKVLIMNSRLLALAALILISRLPARPIPVVNVVELASTADLIVVGQITATKQITDTTLELGTEKVPSRVLTAQLQVQGVLKGTSRAPDLTVRFLLPYEFIGYRTPVVGVSAIFFLNKAGQVYSFTSPYRPSIAGIMSSATREDGTLLDRLAGHVRAVVESAETGLNEKREAIYALGDIPGEASTQALQFASDLSEPTLRLSAVAALLRRNNISRLQLAAEVLLSPAEGQPSEVRQNLMAGISQLRDPLSISTLDSLLRAGDDRVRGAAAEALWRTGSPDAIGALARALDDANEQVRYYAVVGLADITGQKKWRPNTFDFRDREASYLIYWKQWRQAH